MRLAALGLTLLVVLAGPVLAQVGDAPIVGGDRDAHGCIGSAGYTYSAVRTECVRLWEVGVRLAPKA